MSPPPPRTSFAAGIARVFGMSDRVWARHQSPWSVWTRAAILPVATVLIGAGEGLGPTRGAALAALVVFAWINPRLFPPPRDPTTWSARAVRGERRWAEARDDLSRAMQARLRRRLLLSAVPIPVWLWALLADQAGLAFVAALATMGLKLRFLDLCAEVDPGPA